MEINELRKFLKDNVVEKKSSLKDQDFELEIMLNSGVNFKIFGIDNPETDKLFAFYVEMPYEVDNYTHTENITENFTEYLCEKYDKNWENDPDFMQEMFMMDTHQTYYNNDGYTPEIEIISKNSNNEKYFDDFNEFIKDKIFICPALPKNTHDATDSTTIYDEGKWAYVKLAPIEKVKNVIDFNGGIKLENQMLNKPKMR